MEHLEDNGQCVPRDELYDYTGVVNTNVNVSPWAAVMVVELMMKEDNGASVGAALIAVVQAIPEAPVVPVLPTTTVSETKTVRGFAEKDGAL